MTAGRTNSQSLSQHWGTPPKYVNAVHTFFGAPPELDPCSNEYSIVGARTEWRLPFQDGLELSWNASSIYVNPPYGADRTRGTRIRDWLKKCSDAYHTNQAEVLALVPVAANTRHWKECVWASAVGVCFLYDTRLKFLEDGADVGKGAPMACAVVYWGEQFERFASVFRLFGACLDLRDVILPPVSRSESLQQTLPLEPVLAPARLTDR